MQRLLDDKTKPRGSLGRLEELACQVAAIRGDVHIAAEPPRKAVVVMGADHGVAEESVSAYPQEVTAQMLLNFARGGAAINVLARQAGARVVVVDMGVKSELPPLPEIRSLRIGAGTRNFTREAAMSRGEAVRALEVGIAIAEELAADGITLLGIGDMGIGNTTASSALTAAFTGAAPAEVVGRGTGHRRRRPAPQDRGRSGARWPCTAPTPPTPSVRWRSSAASRSRGWPASCWARRRRASR